MRRFRRAGRHVARPPLELSTRSPAEPGRGPDSAVEARRQTEAGWREVWADELTRGAR